MAHFSAHVVDHWWIACSLKGLSRTWRPHLGGHVSQLAQMSNAIGEFIFHIVFRRGRISAIFANWRKKPGGVVFLNMQMWRRARTRVGSAILQPLEARLLLSSVQTLASFSGIDGAHPMAGLVRVGDLLYGTTADGGASGDGEVFALPLGGGQPQVLTSFNGTDGAHPLAGLTLWDDRLYGTTSQGGAANGDGTVFSIPLTGGTPDVLVSFNGQNGQKPAGGVAVSDDTLYGTTQYGGEANGDGTVFSVPLGGGMIRLIASFDGADGADPFGDLILSGGTLLGTVAGGGVNGIGGVFAVSSGGGTPTLLPSSSPSSDNGQSPQNLGLVHLGNSFYGTELNDGSSADGDVFSIPAGEGTPTVIASFNGADGAEPSAGLILVGTTLYGTTQNGGAGGDGTVFAVDVSASTPVTVVTTAAKKKSAKPQHKVHQSTSKAAKVRSSVSHD